jgi:hypothetical protein
VKPAPQSTQSYAVPVSKHRLEALSDALRIRVWTLVGCATTAFAVAFVAPIFNMFAMLPTAFLPRLASLSGAQASVKEV